MRGLFLALVCAVIAGCGSSAPPADPAKMVGAYDVMIASGGQTDVDVMNVTIGSGTDVLLDFVDGVSTPTGLGVRCTVMGSTKLEIVRQKLTVKHATGEANGIGSGMGTIDATGKVDLTLTVVTEGVGPPDAGSGGAPVSYHITGARAAN